MIASLSNDHDNTHEEFPVIRKNAKTTPKPIAGLGRSATDQVLENLRAALHVLDMVPIAPSELTPHPLIIVRAEIENARRYCRAQMETSLGLAA